MDDSGLSARLTTLRLTPNAAAAAAGSLRGVPQQPSAVILVDTQVECGRVCKLLAAQPRLALDLEGVDLCRSGRVCILQVGCLDGRVYLFDVCTLSSPTFPEALRADVLENEAVQKLMFDCRSDADALFHLHSVSIKNVIDLQVLCVKSFSRSARHLPGMNKALSEVLSPVAFAEAERIKAVGKTLFAPEKGGSYDVWTQRPLAPALVEYAAADVLHIFAMHTRWSPLMLETVARNIAAARMRSTIERRTPWPRGPRSKWSEIDF